MQRKGWILETGRLVGEVLDFIRRFFLNPSHLALYIVFSNAASSGWLSPDLQLSFSATCLPTWAYTSTLLSFYKRNWVLFWTSKIMLPSDVCCLLAAVILSYPTFYTCSGRVLQPSTSTNSPRSYTLETSVQEKKKAAAKSFSTSKAVDLKTRGSRYIILIYFGDLWEGAAFRERIVLAQCKLLENCLYNGCS